MSGEIIGVWVIAQDRRFCCMATMRGWICGNCGGGKGLAPKYLNVRRVGIRCPNCEARVIAIRKQVVTESVWRGTPEKE